MPTDNNTAPTKGCRSEQAHYLHTMESPIHRMCIVVCEVNRELDPDGRVGTGHRLTSSVKRRVLQQRDPHPCSIGHMHHLHLQGSTEHCQNGSLLWHVAQQCVTIGYVSSIYLSNLRDCPHTDTSLCYCNYPFLTVNVLQKHTVTMEGCPTSLLNSLNCLKPGLTC